MWTGVSRQLYPPSEFKFVFFNQATWVIAVQLNFTFNFKNKDSLTGQFGSGCKQEATGTLSLVASAFKPNTVSMCFFVGANWSCSQFVCDKLPCVSKQGGIVLTGGLRAVNTGLVCGDAGVTERYANQQKRLKGVKSLKRQKIIKNNNPKTDKRKKKHWKMGKMILGDVGRVPLNRTTEALWLSLLLLASCISPGFCLCLPSRSDQIQPSCPHLYPPPASPLHPSDHLRLAHVQSSRAFERIWLRGVIVCKGRFSSSHANNPSHTPSPT